MKKIVMFALSLVGSFLLSMGTSYSAEIDEINAAIKATGAKWVAGETSVSNLPIELKRRLCGLKYDTPERLKGHVVSGRPKLATSSSSGTSFPFCSTSDPVCDWTNRNGLSYVTSVKDQGQCGSCWAFSSTAVAESESLISFNWPGLPLDLSEQIVLSCTNPSTDNCENGGYPSDAANFLESSGTNLESCYPYTATDGYCANACSNYRNNTSTNYYINNWYGSYPTTTNIPTWNNFTYLPTAIQNMKNLLSQGPIVGTMEVYNDFFNYVGGVYYCDPNSGYAGSHAIEIVGWDDYLQAFFVKNSWGPYWGIGGFFWISYYELFGYTYFAYNTYFFVGGKHTPIINFASVVSSVPSTLQISCQTSPNSGTYNTPFSLKWETGTLVSVQALSPQSGSTGCQYVFTNWSNGGGTYPTLTFFQPNVSGQTFTAYFKTQYQLTTNVSGVGTVSPVSGTWYNASASASIVAKPSSGYTFYGWTGDVTGAKNPASIVMSAAHSVTANFYQFSPSLSAPTAGATISSSTQYPIQWDGPSDNLLTYNVFYSVNGGLTWNTIATGQTGLSYSWTVPTFKKATKCLIKVVAYNGKTVIKQLKSGVFTITP